MSVHGKRIAKTLMKHPKFKRKVRVVLQEFKKGKLHSGGGKVVRSRKQALAIALSEARRRMG